MFNVTLKIPYFIAISCLKTFIGLLVLINSDNLLIFKFRNSKFDLTDNFVNN